MKRKALLLGVSLALLLVVPGMALAANPYLHYFDCKECHLATLTVTQMSGDHVCLKCHIGGMGTAPNNKAVAPDPSALGSGPGKINWSSDRFFSVGDASNTLKSNPSADQQTSHHWAAPSTLVAAGAREPSKSLYAGFYSRYGASNGKVTCSRCHNPHGEATLGDPASPNNLLANPKLLQRDASNLNKPMDPEQMCQACHVDFNQATGNHGFLSHPLVQDYAAIANSELYTTGAKKGWLKPLAEIGGAGVGGKGTLQPYTGTLKAMVDTNADGIAETLKTTTYANGVVCTTCHGVHAVDSSSATADGFDSPDTPVAGDGKLLRTDGRDMSGTLAGAARSSVLCSACHNFGAHGSPTSRIGCLDCHSSHVPGTGNLFVLRNEVTLPGGMTLPKDETDTQRTATGLNYGLPGTLWINGGSGYCEGCHDIPSSISQHTAIPVGKQANAEYCGSCHNHANASGSFGGACNSCHGFPPSDGAVVGGTTGYAKNDNSGVTYLTVNGGATFKNETNTPHKRHAAGSSTGNYSFACQECHYSVTLGTSPEHANDNYQDVLFEGPVSKTVGIPVYTAAGSGSCATLYCHSNGNPRSNGALKYSDAAPVWKDGSLAPNKITSCDVCHGNSDATMAAGDRSNSSTHKKHIAKYACNVCHANTASSNTALKIQGGEHVNGLADVSFDNTLAILNTSISSNSYEMGAGTCNVYCHSNGTTELVGSSAPDWDAGYSAASACGICHQVAATDTVNPLGGAHRRHVFDADGPKLACDFCHGVGAAGGTHGTHINGTVNAPKLDAEIAAKCNGCHGATLGQTGNDAPPVWSDSNSVTCEICHTGSAIATINTLAPAKSLAASSGHNRTTASGVYSVSGNVAANKACVGCHDQSNATGHIDGTPGNTDRLIAAAATCTTSCHGVGGSAVKDGIYTHQAKACTVCHDPHGTTNIYMVRATSSDFSGTVVFTARTDANSYDEDDNADGGVTENNADDICATCHSSANGTSHNNRQNTDSQAPAGHKLGQNCFACHKAHTDADAPFGMGAGTACDDCHGFPPATAAHQLHAPDSAALASPVTVDGLDRSACSFCHTGAGSYTYDLSADNSGGLNHGDATGRVTLLAASVGYNAGSQNCTAACHNLASGQAAAWTAASLACDACHGNPPANGGGNGSAHVDHVAHGQIDCATCHGTLPTDTVHISVKTGATEALRVQNAAIASADEANVVVDTWNDADNTCANAACHNPSNDGKLADWDTSISSCSLCHGTAATMTSGSHVKHLALDTSCTKCHTAIVGGTGHLNLTVDMQGALNFDANTAEPKIPNTCNSTVCHYDPQGKNGVNSPLETDPWGTAIANTCGNCHGNPSFYGDHDAHFSDRRVTNGMSCFLCHSETVDSDNKLIPQASGGKHLNNSKVDVAFAGNYASQPVTADVPYNPLVDPSSCSVNCHATGNPKVWAPPASCADCHGGLTANARHAAHINIDPSIEADRSECVICHGSDVLGYQLNEGGVHQDGNLDFATGIADGGTAPDYTCSTACHVSTAGIDGSWNDSNGLGCDACHAYPMQDGAHDKHILAGMICSNCHGAVDAAGTSPLTHNHGKDLDSNSVVNDGESLTTRGKAMEVSEGYFTVNLSGLDIYVDDSAYSAGAGNTWVNSYVTDDGGNSCANALCHNPSATVGKNVDWDEDEASCVLCHGHDGTSGPMIATGSHANHLNAEAKFGIDIGCNRCHPDNTGNFAHFLSGTPKVPNGAVRFGGSVITTEYQGEAAIPNTGFGTCATNACHNNGQGAAPVAAFTWGTSVATDCQFCHDDPPTTGRHQVHLGAIVSYGPYGGVQTWACGDCHDANSSATRPGLSMTGRTTHIDGMVTFAGGNTVPVNAATNDGIVVDSSVTACNYCHGAQDATANANAALAKAVWYAGTAPGCGSCHGDYTAANSKADGSGVIAPSRAGSDYAAAGHGKARTPADALLPANADRAVAKGCSDCHDRTVAHISGTLADANRLKTLSGKDYENLAQRNDWCSGCHNSAAHGHFANTNTAGGESDDGLYCAICHDPHGQGGQDAMVATSIQGSLVSGFADRKLRSSYSNNTYTGVCQICHDNGEVQYFNRTTDSLGSHMGESQCSDCHKHTDNPAFQASGCSGCHGGGYFNGVTTFTNNYWPDSSNARAENTAGRHAKHMERIAGVLYGETITQLLADTGNGATDTKQKAICAYCHDGPGVTNHNNGVTNVNSMFNMWGSPAAMDNGVWTAGVNNGNCSNVNCHNNLTTPTGYGWYGANVTTCTMCHSNTAPDNLAANNIHPSTGLHRVVNTGIVQSHNQTMVGGGCSACHDSVKAIPGGVKLGLAGGSNTHIDGIANGDSAANDDRFLKATIGYADGAANFGSCGGTGGILFSCHSDRGNWHRIWSKDADKVEYNTPGVPSSGPIWGGARCAVCHGFPDGPGTGWRTGMTVNHALPGDSNNFTGAHATCEYCHVAPAGPYATYSYLTMHENGLVETNNGAGVGYDSDEGSCMNFCHSGGGKQTMGGSTLWNHNPLLGASPTCNECHNEEGGGLLEPYKTTSNSLDWTDGSGNSISRHKTHVEIAATVYADTTNRSTADKYSYGCANCHPNHISYHNDGVIQVSLNSTHGGQTKSKNAVSTDPAEYALGTFNAVNNWAINSGGIVATGGRNSRSLTCSASYCHSDGKGMANSVTPNWYGGSFAALPGYTGDRCMGCHANSPAGTSHQPHNVGIHYNNIYTGNTGVVKDASLKQNAHGVGENSTTMSCYLCHNNTIKEKTNARNSVCISCHTPVASPSPADISAGNAEAIVHSRVYHINGSPDVWFADVSVLSRAQLRDPLGNVPDVQAAWKRQNGYKSQVPGVTSYDQTWDYDANLARKLDTGTMYEPTTKNCTVACHNNVQIGWGSSSISCSNCHTQLPK